MTTTYHRKVIKIRAVDSPNVRLALAQQARGMPVSGDTIIDGVLTWDEYLHRRATWDQVRQCVGLDAEFWLGAELLLFPPDWLNRSEVIATLLAQRSYAGQLSRRAKAIGIDPAEGGDKTSMCAVDELGVIDLVSRKTPNTDDVPREALAFMRKHQVPAHNVVFDRGGGGKQHADRLRARGYNVRTVAFGESLVLDPKRGKRMFDERKDIHEERYAYLNRRCEMYWELSALVDISRGENQREEGQRGSDGSDSRSGPQVTGATSAPRSQLQTLLGNDARGGPTAHRQIFAIPAFFSGVTCDKHGNGCLRGQLAVMPRLYDKEGRCRMLAKNRVAKADAKQSKAEKVLVELIGHSPDESDALVLAVHGMLHKPVRTTAGVVG